MNEGNDGGVELGLLDVRIGTEGEERVRGYARLMRRVYSIEVRLQLTCLLFHLLITQQLLTQRWGGLYKSSGLLLAHNLLHLAHPAQHSHLADFSLHRLVPPIYLPLVLFTCTFYRRTRRWHRITPVSADRGCFFRPDLPCNHSRRFFAILLSPSSQRIQICCQCATHSIRACVFPQIPDISSYSWRRRLRNSANSSSSLSINHFTCVSVRWNTLYSGSTSSQSALIISEAFITVLFLFVVGTSCAVVSVGCRESSAQRSLS